MSVSLILMVVDDIVSVGFLIDDDAVWMDLHFQLVVGIALYSEIGLEVVANCFFHLSVGF